MKRGTVARRLLSWRVIAAILAGMLAGSIIMTPVGAHVTDSVKHLINKHIKKQFYTKKQSTARFVLKTDSTALAGFKNGPGDVYSGPAVSDPGAVIGTFAVPAGNYAIFVKFYIEDLVDLTTVTCRLEAGADFDQTVVGTVNFQSAVSLQVVHAFPSAGSVVVRCRDGYAPPNTDTTYNFLKITAIEQGSISNVALT